MDASHEPRNVPPGSPRERRHSVTELLTAWREGDGDAAAPLFERVYEELHRIARRQLGHERAGHTLSTTAVVHEAYFKLVGQTRVEWADRGHFFAVAARAMRRILLDYARRRRAAKRGGAERPVTLDEETLGDAALATAAMAADERAEVLIALDEALARLAALDERQARVVECRFFGGLTEEETAHALGVTERTVRRDWVKAKAWLYRALHA
jgi:RNA polymerase sigma factor (TIGR02999 family)